MADRFVRKTGSDANDGLTPAMAWLTLGKALGAAGAASGDVIYVGAGIYRESVTVGLTPAAETKVIGDVDGAKTGDPGEVVWSCHGGGDAVAPTLARCLALNAKGFLTFEKLTFVGGTTSPHVIQASVAGSRFVTLRDCIVICAMMGDTITVTSNVDQSLGWVVERCVFVGGASHMSFRGPSSTVGDYDLDVNVRNCLFVGGQSAGNVIQDATNATNAGRPGGVKVYNCSFIGCNTPIRTGLTQIAATTASLRMKVYNCLIYGATIGLRSNGAAANELDEDWNVIQATTPRTNVSAGANSKSGAISPVAFMFEVMAPLLGRAARPFGMPSLDSPLLAFGGQVGGPAADMLGVMRPAGGKSLLQAVGALERKDSGVREIATVRTGASALVIEGPGVHDFEVPVDAVQTTVSVYGRFDSTHGAGSRPQLRVLAAADLGVTEQTATMTVAADTWEQISVTFTPTAAGIVRVRLISRAAAGGGKAFFDDADVTDAS